MAAKISVDQPNLAHTDHAYAQFFWQLHSLQFFYNQLYIRNHAQRIIHQADLRGWLDEIERNRLENRAVAV